MIVIVAGKGVNIDQYFNNKYVKQITISIAAPIIQFFVTSKLLVSIGIYFRDGYVVTPDETKVIFLSVDLALL
jgi:hypothetical protein